MAAEMNPDILNSEGMTNNGVNLRSVGREGMGTSGEVRINFVEGIDLDSIIFHVNLKTGAEDEAGKKVVKTFFTSLIVDGVEQDMCMHKTGTLVRLESTEKVQGFFVRMGRDTIIHNGEFPIPIGSHTVHLSNMRVSRKAVMSPPPPPPTVTVKPNIVVNVHNEESEKFYKYLNSVIALFDPHMDCLAPLVFSQIEKNISKWEKDTTLEKSVLIKALTVIAQRHRLGSGDGPAT